MDRFFFIAACLFGFIGVALGAFAAHGLKNQLDASSLMTFETGVRYLMYHTFALLATALAYSKWRARSLLVSGWMFITGIVLFSGSLIALSLSGIQSLGIITPFGGVAFLTGWLCMAWSIWKK